ncbi:MAG: hypothetical protein D6B28_05155 [Gammaproteobacteria bacterium]|nr:MAG: hypothetical protein D6B28_05155 [Gammaproteobacteria bacterium]
MDNIANHNLFKQVRIAHRLLASYYSRVHQLIKDVSSDERLGLEFFIWGPTKFNRPCQRGTNVLERWSWDLLPGGFTQYLFLNGSEKKPQQPGEWMLAICVISDTAVFDEEMKENLDADEFDVLAEDAHSVLRCYLVAPHKELNLYWADEIWDGIDWPKCTESPEIQCMHDERQVYASAFEMPLEELTAKDCVETLVQKIIEYRDVVLPVK